MTQAFSNRARSSRRASSRRRSGPGRPTPSRLARVIPTPGVENAANGAAMPPCPARVSAKVALRKREASGTGDPRVPWRPRARMGRCGPVASPHCACARSRVLLRSPLPAPASPLPARSRAPACARSPSDERSTRKSAGLVPVMRASPVSAALTAGVESRSDAGNGFSGLLDPSRRVRHRFLRRVPSPGVQRLRGVRCGERSLQPVPSTGALEPARRTGSVHRARRRGAPRLGPRNPRLRDSRLDSGSRNASPAAVSIALGKRVAPGASVRGGGSLRSRGGHGGRGPGDVAQ